MTWVCDPKTNHPSGNANKSRPVGVQVLPVIAGIRDYGTL